MSSDMADTPQSSERKKISEQMRLVEDLLERHGLNSQSGPQTGRWSKFLVDVVDEFSKVVQSQQRQELLMQISFQEVQEWWELIKRRESVIKSVLDASKDIIVTLDSHGQVDEFNHNAERTFKRTKSDLQGRPVTAFLAAGLFLDEVQHLLRGEEGAELNGHGLPARRTIDCIDGSSFQAEVVVSKILAEKSPIYVFYIRDLTEQMESQKILEESRSQATQSAKMASLGEMAGGIAHEINTPLNIFTLNAEMLRESAQSGSIDQKTIFETADSIETTAIRISKIVQGLRNFSRDDSQDEMTTTTIADIVEDTVSLCRQRFVTHGISLRIGTVAPDIAVLGRRTSLGQVLLNLLNNAHDAIEGLAERWIDVSFQTRDGNVIISVTDSGSGIPPEIVDKLMNPFFTTKPVGKGTGLGLSISKSIIEKHSGRLDYDSSHCNTRFVISLPLYSSDGVAA